MCYNGFTIKINLFKSKRFEDGRCTYKNTGSSHLNSPRFLFLSRGLGGLLRENRRSVNRLNR